MTDFYNFGAAAVHGSFYDRGGFGVNLGHEGFTPAWEPDGYADAAIAAAIAVLPANGGRLICPDGKIARCANPIALAGKQNIRISGASGASGGNAPSFAFWFDGVGSRFLDLRSSIGCEVEGVMLRALNTAFAGDLIDLSHNGGGGVDTQMFVLKRSTLYGFGPLASHRSLLCLDNAVDLTIDDNSFLNAPIGILGRVAVGSYCNLVSITRGRFVGIGTMPIRNPGQAWTIARSNFEGVLTIAATAWSSATAYVVGNLASRLGVVYRAILAHTNQQPPNATYWTVVSIAAGAVDFTGGCAANGLGFHGNWMGDAHIAGTWLSFAGNGLEARGNYFSAGVAGIQVVGGSFGIDIGGGNDFEMDAAANPIVFTGPCTGVNIHGNASPTSTVPILGDQATYAHVNYTVLGNKGITDVTGSLVSSRNFLTAQIANGATFTISGIPTRRVVLVAIAYQGDPNKHWLGTYQTDGAAIGTLTVITNTTGGGFTVAATAMGVITVTNAAGGSVGFAWGYSALTAAV